MFNLIVGSFDGKMDASRVLEYTDSTVKGYVLGDGRAVDASRLINLPTLVMPETGAPGLLAHVGRLDSLTPRGSFYAFRFTPTPGLAPIPTDEVEAAASALGVDDWEFRRTHWAVKDSDLYHVLFARLVAAPAPKVFKLPPSPPEADLVAVMMPFDARFTAVYEAIQTAVGKAGLRCQTEIRR